MQANFADETRGGLAAQAPVQVAFAIGFGSGGTIAGFLYEADPLLPFIVTAALALPVAATIAAVLSSATAPLKLTSELS